MRARSLFCGMGGAFPVDVLWFFLAAGLRLAASSNARGNLAMKPKESQHSSQLGMPTARKFAQLPPL
jgi:hypothetical protein